MLDLYTDYLITSTKYTTATGLSRLFNNRFSHDQVTRFLNSQELDNKKLWSFIKPFLRSVEKDSSVLIVDDTILEKPYTDESEINTYHYDHSKGRSIKGINVVNLIHETEGTRLPISMSIVHKDKLVEQNGKQHRKSSKTKNELFREQFIMPLKVNRKVSLHDPSNPENREYVSVESLKLQEDKPVKVWLKGYSKPLLLAKQVFKNKDKSTGILYLVASDLTASYSCMTIAYQRRWAVETYHRSLKNNTSVCASPTKTIKTQCNHIYASVMAFVKLEVISIKKAVSQYALKSQLYLKGIQTAFDELNTIKYGVQLDLDF